MCLRAVSSQTGRPEDQSVFSLSKQIPYLCKDPVSSSLMESSAAQEAACLGAKYVTLGR